MRLHSLDGLTPAVLLLLLLLLGRMKKKNQVQASFIFHKEPTSLLCKVTVLIYLAVQTMRSGDNKKKKKGAWCHEECG